MGIGDYYENYSTGYVKSYRSTMEKGWYKKSEYFHLWHHLLYKANHEGIEFMFAGKNIKLKPGQFVTGRLSLSIETGIHESKIERILNFFEKSEQQIEQQKSNKWRVISILNWDKYQNSEQQIEQRVNNKRTTTEQRVNTNNNDNNDKNDKNIIITWRESFEIYKSMLNKEYNRLINDQNFVQKQQELNPGINIKLSLQKAKENYWEREVGWKKKKSSRSKTIDWEQTFINALTLPSNRVWKPKDEIEYENNGPRIIKDW